MRIIRVFLDTNIILDVLLNRAGFVADSEAVLLRCESLGARVYIAWHSLATAYYLLRRRRTEAEALQHVDKILAWARISTTSDADARRARTFAFDDFEDALQAVAAEACEADYLVTRDLDDFKASAVRVISPAEFVASPIELL